MIVHLLVLDLENRENTNFQFIWFISFLDINFNVQISKCSKYIRFISKTFKNCLQNLQDTFNNLTFGLSDHAVVEG